MSLSQDYPTGYWAYKNDPLIREAIDNRVKACENRLKRKELKEDLIRLVQGYVYSGWRMPHSEIVLAPNFPQYKREDLIRDWKELIANYKNQTR